MRRREFLAFAPGRASSRLSAQGQQPDTYRIGYLALSPGENNTHMKPFTSRLRELGLVEGKNLEILYAISVQQVVDRFGEMDEAGVEAAIALEDPFIFNLQPLLAELSIRHKIPTSFAERSFVTAGGLVGFGPNRTALFQRAADYVERILKGIPPGNSPVEQSTVFELAVALKAARSIGIDVPASLLAGTDEVIE